MTNRTVQQRQTNFAATREEANQRAEKIVAQQRLEMQRASSQRSADENRPPHKSFFDGFKKTLRFS